jgi:hypothetical protein
MERAPQRRRIEELESLFLGFIRTQPGKTLFIEFIFPQFTFTELYRLARVGNREIKNFFETHNVWDNLLKRITQGQQIDGQDKYRLIMRIFDRHPNPLWRLLAYAIYEYALEGSYSRFIFPNAGTPNDYVEIEREMRLGETLIRYSFQGESMYPRIWQNMINTHPSTRERVSQDPRWNIGRVSVTTWGMAGYAANLRRIYTLFRFELAVTILGGTVLGLDGMSVSQCIECGFDAQQMCAKCEQPFCSKPCHIQNHQFGCFKN